MVEVSKRKLAVVYVLFKWQKNDNFVTIIYKYNKFLFYSQMNISARSNPIQHSNKKKDKCLDVFQYKANFFVIISETDRISR